MGVKGLFQIILVSFTIAVGCYDRGQYPPEGEFSERATMTFNQLRSMSSSSCREVNSEVICVGRVTSSDREGNFYRRLCVEDATGAVELHLGIYDMHTEYPVGLEVALLLQGCATQLIDGVVHIGLPPLSYDHEVRDMEARVVIDKHIVRGVSVVPPMPIRCNLQQLSGEACGRLVEVENLRYAPLEEELQKENRVEYHRFVDGAGAEIFCYISEYANFYGIEFSVEPLSICGILSIRRVDGSDGSKFVLTPRYAEDISLYNSAN